mgnify:CR=1 FL=1|jgi:hypothetical protein
MLTIEIQILIKIDKPISVNMSMKIILSNCEYGTMLGLLK